MVEIKEKIKSINGLTHKIAIKLSDKLNTIVEKDGTDKLMMDYVLEAWLINISKGLVVICISFILGILFETIITLISFNIIRSRAHGMHARSSISCFVSSILYFNVFVYFANMISLSSISAGAISIIIIILIAVYAPSDTEKRPLVGAEARKKLKVQSVIAAIIVCVCAVIIPYGNIKSLIILGAIVETLSILPITYKISNRRYNNYENYEKRT